MKNKFQDLIDAKEIEFDPPETPNVITAPMPKHDQGINVIDGDLSVSSVNELATPLPVVKENLLQAGLFLGSSEDCYHCVSLTND